MNKKNYRTLNGLYKALLPITNNYCGMCKMEKNEKDIAIFFGGLYEDIIYGPDIVRLLPILKRANWMVRRNYSKIRLEILVWIDNGTI